MADEARSINMLHAYNSVVRVEVISCRMFSRVEAGHTVACIEFPPPCLSDPDAQSDSQEVSDGELKYGIRLDMEL